MPEWILARANGDQLVRVDLEGRRKLTIGRSPRCDLCLKSPSISRRHALLFRHMSHWHLVDTGSRFGLWNATGRCSSMRLTQGTWVRLGIGLFGWPMGDISGSEHGRGIPALGHVSAPLSHSPGSGSRLAIAIAGPGCERTREVEIHAAELTTLGRASTCDVVLDDSSVSALHAVIYLEGARWCIADAGSRAGIRAGDRRYRRKRLEAGSIVQLGDTRMWIRTAIIDCDTETYDVSPPLLASAA